MVSTVYGFRGNTFAVQGQATDTLYLGKKFIGKTFIPLYKNKNCSPVLTVFAKYVHTYLYKLCTN